MHSHKKGQLRLPFFLFPADTEIVEDLFDLLENSSRVY
jgi:hypothetical protein